MENNLVFAPESVTNCSGLNMEKESLFKYFRDYKGKILCPYIVDSETSMRLLWCSEEMICNCFDEFRSTLTDDNAENEIISFVEAYVGKRAHYE